MSEPMPYGEMVQELTFLRAQYEQFIIDRERERIVALIEQERDSWTRQATFSYKNALTELIQKIEAMR